MKRLKRLSGIILSVVMAVGTALSGNMANSVYADVPIMEYADTEVSVNPEFDGEESIVEVEDIEEAIEEENEEPIQDEIVTDEQELSDDEISEESGEVISEEEIIEDDEDSPAIEDDEVEIAEDGWGNVSDEEYDNTVYDDLDYVLGELPAIEDTTVESIHDFGDDMVAEEMALSEDSLSIPKSFPVTNKTGKTRDELIAELISYADEYYPGLRNQGSYGTCWAHASMALAEINMIKKGKISASDADYSELALAYYLMHTVVDPLGGTVGDSNNDGPSTYGRHDWLVNGGNLMYSTRALANWVGATDESYVPYSKASYVHTNGLESTYAFMDKAHLNAFAQVGIGDRDAIKALIMENGAAGVSYHAADSGAGESNSTYYNAANNCWYYPNSKGTNHAVTIVGWDDEFSRDNFNVVAGSKPSGDGAWLIRNSWYSGSPSDKYSLRGYFWISYYDANLSNVFAMEFDDSDNYEYNYQYDGSVMSANVGLSNLFSAANVFEVKADDDGENLRAVSFCTNNTTNQEYTIDIYVNPQNGDPTSGTLMEDSTVSGMTTYAGYYTVELPDPVFLDKGDKVAIVVSMKKSGDMPGISCEYKSSGSWIESITAAKSNQSYIYDYTGDDWEDLGAAENANFRIKAFTDGVDPSQDWKYEKHNIHYVLDGGKNSASNPSYTRWISPDITLANPTKAGFVFGGWYTDAAFTDRIKVIETGTMADVTVYAKWSECKYNVKFSTNGGTGTMTAMQDVLYDKSYTLPTNKFTKKGYVFKSWNTKKDGSGKSYSNKASIKNLTKTNGATITLYAQWKIATYSITYKLNGGKNSSKNPSSYKMTSNTITLANPTRKGCTFVGWYSDSKYTKKVTKISSGSTGNKTLYAKWTTIKYTITYKLNGGKNNSKNPTSYKVTTADILLRNPSKKGYAFKGWYKDKNFKTRVSMIEKGSTGNKTLYAKWTKNQYSIKYYLDGGLNISLNPTAYTVTTPTINLVSPIKTGYSFGGWYSDSSFKHRVTSIKKGSTGNLKLYAKWVSSGTYTIRFSGNGATGGSMDDIKGISYEQIITLPLNRFTKTGYTFYGWNSRPDGQGVWARNGQQIGRLGTRDGDVVVMYAIWK